MNPSLLKKCNFIYLFLLGIADESIQVATVPPFFELVQDILAELAKKKEDKGTSANSNDISRRTVLSGLGAAR